MYREAAGLDLNQH